MDSAACSSWELLNEYKDKNHDPINIISYGFVVKETETYVVLAQNYGMSPEQVCNTMAIPKGCILERVIIGKIDEL